MSSFVIVIERIRDYDYVNFSRKYMFGLLLGYTLLSMMSTLARPDFNLALSMIGLFFFRTFTNDDVNVFGCLICLSFVFDIVWMGIEGDISSHYKRMGLDDFKSVAIFGMVISVFNLIFKLPLLVALKFYPRQPTLGGGDELQRGLVNSEENVPSIVPVGMR